MHVSGRLKRPHGEREVSSKFEGGVEMKKVLVILLVGLMLVPAVLAAGKLKFGVTIEDFNDVFMR